MFDLSIATDWQNAERGWARDLIDVSDKVQRAIQASAPVIEAFCARLLKEEPALRSSLDFGPMVRQGSSPKHSLILCDQSGTELFDPETLGLQEHRMALLAQPGDTVVVRRRVPEFERYLAKYLGLGNVTFLQAGPEYTEPLARKLRTNADLAAKLARAVEAGAPLTVHAYHTNGHVWRLAKALGDMLQIPVSVAGPGSRALKRSNDKLWFWSVARELVGTGSVPPTMHAFGPAGAAAQVARFAQRCESVVVKVPGSAGGRGNLRFESAILRDMSLPAIRYLIETRLRAIGWKGIYPILVGVWECGITTSPSVQMWLPSPDEGPPRILGLFEQRMEGETGRFSGARPAALDEAISEEMVAQAAVLGGLFQRIGYFGPCSLDAVIKELPTGQHELHWIECNGRWSGVSIPLTVATSLLGGSPPEGLVILQEILPNAKSAGTMSLCACLDGLMFKRGASSEGLVILSPPDRAAGLSLNVMAIAHTVPRAAALIERLQGRINSGSA